MYKQRESKVLWYEQVKCYYEEQNHTLKLCNFDANVKRTYQKIGSWKIVLIIFMKILACKSFISQVIQKIDEFRKYKFYSCTSLQSIDSIYTFCILSTYYVD